MNKLGAVDASFLYTETDQMLNHIASVQRFTLPDAVDPDAWIKSLRVYVAERCHRVDYMHRKLHAVPGHFDHPVWVEADDLDIEQHIIEIPLEAPGTTAQLEQKIGEIHSRRMDRSKPLWAMYVVTGLEDGDVAVYNQIHHSAIDGIAGQVATMMIMDTKPDHDAAEASSITAEETGAAEQLHMAFENLAKYQLGAGNRWLGQMDAMRRAVQRAIDPSKSFGALLQPAPKTRFNRAIGSERTYAVAECPFDEVRAMSKQLSCSVNDVFMTICSGALRRYLLRKGELPDTNLIAGCPISLRQPGDQRLGNQVSMMSVDLATTEADPKLRLLKIHQSAQTAKEVTADLAAAYDGETSLFGLPAAVSSAVAAFEQLGAANVVRMPINVVMSNVPGPRDTLFFNGARMTTHFPVSVPAHGVGLNITVQSYQSSLFFGITACKGALPDAEMLRDDLLAAFSELKQVLMPVSNVAELFGRDAAQSASPAGPDGEDAAESRVA